MGMLKNAQTKSAPAGNGPMKGPPDEPPSGGPPDQQPDATPDGQPDAGDGAPDTGDPGNPGDLGDSGDSRSPPSASPGKPPAAPAEDPNDPTVQAQQNMNPQQQAEFHQALKLLYAVLYKNPQTSRAVLNMIQPQDKIGSIAKAAVIVVHQIEKRVKLSDSIVKMALTITIVDRLLELAQKVKGIKFSKPEIAHVLAAAAHGADTLFHGPQPHPGGPQPTGASPPPGGPPGGAPPAGAGSPPPSGGPPPGPVGGTNGALAQGAAAQAQAQSAQGMPPMPPPVSTAQAPAAQPAPGGQ